VLYGSTESDQNVVKAVLKKQPINIEYIKPNIP